MTATLFHETDIDQVTIKSWLTALYGSGSGSQRPGRAVHRTQLDHHGDDGVADWLSRIYGIGTGDMVRRSG